MTNLTKEQKALLKEIMEKEDPQRKVDEIVRKTKKALKIWRYESTQNKVDKLVKRTLKEMKS